MLAANMLTDIVLPNLLFVCMYVNVLIFLNISSDELDYLTLVYLSIFLVIDYPSHLYPVWPEIPSQIFQGLLFCKIHENNLLKTLVSVKEATFSFH